MAKGLAAIAKSGQVYTVLLPGEESFLIGQCEGKPVAFLFSMKKMATAYLASIGKLDHKVVKEEAKPLLEELVEVGVETAFLDPEDPQALPDPLLIPRFIDHLMATPRG